jgi:hypothetical protein
LFSGVFLLPEMERKRSEREQQVEGKEKTDRNETLTN